MQNSCHALSVMLLYLLDHQFPQIPFLTGDCMGAASRGHTCPEFVNDEGVFAFHQPGYVPHNRRGKHMYLLDTAEMWYFMNNWFQIADCGD